MDRRRAMLVALAVALIPGAATAALDCAGGSLAKLRVAPGRLAFHASVTQRGVTPAGFVAGGLHVRIVAATDGTVLHDVTIPGAEFVARGGGVRYARKGTFTGGVVVKPSRRQQDTIRIAFHESAASPISAGGVTGVRVYVDGGSSCGRTCVAPCRTSGDGTLACARSVAYAPFAGDGFGTFTHRTPSPTSPWCGLAIDADEQDCDFLVAEACALPFPSSAFLVPDPNTPTGLRVHYGADTLPATASGTHIDPTDWNTLDGFSPGPTILAIFPDTGFPVDLAASGVAFHTDVAPSLDPNHPTVLMKAGTGERVVHFAELDANTSDVARRAFIMRPARRLEDGTRYLVAIRRLVDTNGTPIAPRLPFRAVRALVMGDVTESDLAAACGDGCAGMIAAREPSFADVLSRLATNGVDPAELVLAWDFTTASTSALTGWIRSVRDQAFALGTPSFTVTSVTDNVSANIYREIQGTFAAPLFMTADAPASRLNLVNGVPTQNGFGTVPFVVDIPPSVWNGTGTPTPGRPSLWGHGLLGNRFQVHGLAPFANQYGFVMAAVDMQGMSDQDVNTIASQVIPNESNFHFIPERLHQGFLNHLLLGRLLVDPNGFSAAPAFSPGGSPTIDTTEVYYSGGSQGGIFGVAIMSIAEDFKRGFLAVPGANYSTLLHRSIDFDPFLALSRVFYQDRLDEQLVIALIQELWDRAEPQGYMTHLASGDLSTPAVPHKVLIHTSKCDSQVSNVATEIMVRSLGIPSVAPGLQPFFAIPEMSAPYDGSAWVFIDWGKCGSRCNVPGQDDPGAACTTDADCPGLGDPPTRTKCDSGTPPLSNTPPAFENGAHGAEGGAPPTSPESQQVDAFLRPAGSVQQFCTGTCDPF
jgi:hypothetical protein